MKIQLFNDDNRNVLKNFEDNSIHSIVTDPPYGIKFMGKKWDYDVPTVEFWKECWRVMKPGGHILVACGTRTQHRMATNIEEAGFEIRDLIAWLYGSGFPKSLNIGKSINKYLSTGNASWNGTGDSSNGGLGYAKLQYKQGYRQKDYSYAHQNDYVINDERAKQFEGWGTALKPAMELWTLARKPISEKNIALNVLKWRTGGLNIDECRIETEENLNGGAYSEGLYIKSDIYGQRKKVPNGFVQPAGRFPANVILSYNEDEYKLKDNVSHNDYNKLKEWLNENT